MSVSAAIAFSVTTPAIDTAREPLSEARLNANRANAQKSTGPRTVVGKERSRANSAKHYMRAIVVSKGVESAKVEAERRAFIESLGACDAATIKLADHAFRCSRRLEIALDAEDAALAKRVDDADTGFSEQRHVEHRDALQRSEEDSCTGRFRLERTIPGCEWLIGLLDTVAFAIRDLEWCAETTSQLERALGARYFDQWDRIVPATEALMAGQAAEHQRRQPNPTAVKPPGLVWVEFDIEQHAKLNLAIPQRLTTQLQKELAAWEAECDRTQREADQNAKLIALYNEARQNLETLIAQERDLLLERIETLGDEENRAWALSVELAKFDPSDAGRLRNRYVGDARRDLSKALDDFRKALRETQREATQTIQPEPEPPSMATEITTATETKPLLHAVPPAPNEPKREQPSPAANPHLSANAALEQDPTCNDVDAFDDLATAHRAVDIGG